MGLSLLLLLILAAPSGIAIEDRIDVVQVDRRVLAIGADGTFLELELEIGERVLDSRSQGLIGVVTTSARLLGVSQAAASWRELRYRIEERAAAPERIYLADRVALVVLTNRLVGLGPRSGRWNELELGPGESLRSVVVDDNLAGAVTERRAIAFAPASGGFVTIALSPKEELEASSLRDSTLTLTTTRRFLVFRAGADRWIERNRRGRF
jgi:hypothetical protein